MSKFLLVVLVVFHLGNRCFGTLNLFDAQLQLYIPFFDYLWKFNTDCEVRCHRFSLKCFFPPSPFSVCRDINFMHQCCEQFAATSTTPWTSTTPTTPWTSTTPTTPSSTTSTEDPQVELCSPTPPEVCQPEPGCTPSPVHQSRNKWLYQPVCEYKCWEHCFDQCACKTAANGNCEYHPATGMCIARRECNEMSFKESDCRRANSFYSIGGLLCHNRESTQTNCENGTTVFAVNIAGEAHTDARNITYMADNEAFYEDKYNTRMEKQDEQIIGQIEDEDKHLYGSYAFGLANGRDKRQCLDYSIFVRIDGDFELAIRTLEPIYDRVGQRIFSLTLNQLPIALHADLHALSGSKWTPVDIVANFRLETISNRRVIRVKGHRQKDFTGKLQVGFCISDCRLCEEYHHLDPGYVGSALSLVHF